MKFSKPLFVYVVCAILMSCNRTEAPKEKILYCIRPNSQSIKSDCHFSTLVESYKIIPLETTEDNLISYIYKIEIWQDKIFILDKKSQDKILVFGLDGKYLYGIGTQGRAANEYVSLGGFTIDRVHDQVLILDDATQKLNFYDLNGKFIRNISLDFIARDVAALGNGNLAFAGGGRGRNRLLLTSASGQLLSSLVPSNDKNWVMMLNAFAPLGDSLIYRNYLNDTLYTITPQGEVLASRFVDFGSDALTWDKFMSYDSYRRENIEDQLSNYRCNLKYYAETANQVCFLYGEKGVPQYVVYDKKTGRTAVYSLQIYNDLTFDRMPPLIVGATPEYFIGQSDMYSVLSRLSETESATPSIDSLAQQRLEQIREIAAQSTENSNPIVTLIKFKQL